LRPPWGRRKGGLRVFFLDESGFGLSLPPTYAWARRGEAGRVNAVAHLERRSCGGWALGYALLEGRCGTGEVVAYLEELSREVGREGVRGVVFLDNAPFHRSRGFREAVERWRGRGLEVAYLPRYSPHLNPVETIWRRVKGFLMPRRHYRSVEELRGAVAVAMERLREQLGQGVLQSLCIGT
jgi:putative transposase